jgi:hypothetical protein
MASTLASFGSQAGSQVERGLRHRYTSSRFGVGQKIRAVQQKRRVPAAQDRSKIEQTFTNQLD